jgi:phage gp37-like protein
MPWTFNPFSGTFDQKGSGGGGGGGSAFFAGEVATYADLPLDGTAALNSRWLVRTNSGTWPFSSYKQSGIYIRTATVGSSRDNDYKLTDTSFHDVMSDDAFLIFDNTDPTKAAKFDVGAQVGANQTRVITVPNKNITLDDAGDSRTPTSHTHGNLTNDGKIGTTANLPLKTGSGGVVEAGAFGTAAGSFCEGNDARLSDARTPSSTLAHAASHAAGGSDPVFDQDLNTTSNVEFNGITTTDFTFQGANFPAENIQLSGTLSFTGASAATNADTTRTNIGAAASGSITTSGLTQATARILGRTTASTGAVEEIQIGSGLSLSAGELSATGSGVTAVGASAADVFSVSGGTDLVADDGGLINSANPAIVWNDASGKLVYQNPLERPSGAGSMFIGLAPSTTALGTNAINIQAARTAASQVAGGANGVVVGNQLRCEGSASVGIGFAGTSQSNANCTGVGATHSCFAANATAIGNGATANFVNSTAIGDSASDGNGGRGSFATRPFGAVYWGGQTTNATATILNLDATATNRFTIAANTALAVDILLVARRSDTADKWLVARRFLGIRRNGSNGTALIGTVQTLGTDQSDGSPSWTFALTADDTNEALQLEVTGAASETVQWRATAFYRVV